MDEQQRKEIFEEYYWIQKRIGDYDQQIIAVKSLSITAGGAIIVAGLSQNQAQPLLFLISFLASLTFLYIDLQWRSYQMAAIQISNELEKIIRSDADYRGPSIGKFYKKYFTIKYAFIRLFSMTRIISISLPTVPIALLSLYLYFESLRDPKLLNITKFLEHFQF